MPDLLTLTALACVLFWVARDSSYVSLRWPALHPFAGRLVDDLGDGAVGGGRAQRG
jgi:hypothetical protein